MSSRTDNFFTLIEQFKSTSLHGDRVPPLHAMRDLYNRSKHKPQEPLALGEAIRTVQNTVVTLNDVCALGIGAVGTPFERELMYHLWIAFWDNYANGVTEAAIMLPSDHWTYVGTVDTLHMDIQSWDALKAKLLAHPRFRMGKDHFEPKVWEGFHAEGDFLNAGVWDGDYGELVRLVAPFDDSSIGERMLPGLARHDSLTSIGTALIAAMIDIVRSSSEPMSRDELAEAIKTRANSEYAMPRDKGSVAEAAAQIATLVDTVPLDQRQRLAGPVLVLRRGPKKPTMLAGPPWLDLDGNAVVLGFSDGISINVSMPATRT
ncbi:hypothetical protein DBIPINDM_007235 (plasmid) [Mesorhizobium sp. AR02]|uniref:hypothetical protein n=1 Tax=Mesorhizobium sp. AR02 TaxID=2865837 RepID=UPI00215F47AC|nr:hypothetical protein [Mesorhizobium sp. AR02]UVK49992.1 hypothetical protein DBIPINDM_007235 [Mesorhizobium sp. AR02]